jgi:hypothetical protein
MPSPITNTGQDLIIRCRSLVAEPSSGFYNDDEFLRWLNDGYLDFSAKTRILKTEVTVPSEAGKADYPLHENYVQMLKVFYKGVRIPPATLNQVLAMTSGGENINNQGEPELYFFMGAENSFRCLHLWKVPANAGDEIKYWMVAKPDELTKTTSPLLPIEWHNALIFWATAMAHLKQRQFSDYDRLMRMYEGYVDKVASRRVREHLDEPILFNDEEIFSTSARPTW